MLTIYLSMFATIKVISTWCQGKSHQLYQNNKYMGHLTHNEVVNQMVEQALETKCTNLCLASIQFF